jgi:hypothetical protein
VLWPPNNELVNVKILGVTDPDGDDVQIMITGVTSDEPTQGLDDDDPCPDAEIVGDGSVELRAQRAGSGNGRVYTVHFTATDESGDSCEGMVYVCVPHDQGKGRRGNGGTCVRDEFQYDATYCGAAKARLSEPATQPVVARVAEGGVAILFSNERSGPVDLSIFDLRGRLVRRLSARDFPAGTHTVQWDGRNAQGQMAASGVYLVRVVMDGRSYAAKAVLLR